MRLFLLLLFALLLNIKTSQASVSDSLLSKLDRALVLRDSFELKKINRIDSLKNKIRLQGYNKDQNFFYKHYLEIYDEYSSFIYDSCNVYARKLLATAFKLKDFQKVDEARIKISFSLISAGFFKEAVDTLFKIQAKNLSDSLKSRYYFICARAFYDLSEYYQDSYYSLVYNIKGEKYIDSAIFFTNSSSLEYKSLTGLKNLRNGNINTAKENYEYLLQSKSLSPHQFAIAASSLSFVYYALHLQDKSIAMIIHAAIFDIENSIKESIALRNLADLLFQIKDIDRASKYVIEAVKDAEYYGARHRKTQIISLLMKIQNYKLMDYDLIQKNKDAHFWYIVTLILLLCFGFVIFGLFYYRIQLKIFGYKKEKNKLEESHRQLLLSNKTIVGSIGALFGLASDYIHKIEKLKLSLLKITKLNKASDLKDSGLDSNPQLERNLLFANFDKVFLTIYPNFIIIFNSYFAKEDQIIVDKKHFLPIEIRIYALIKLGIIDNQEIANILNYSVNTIYTYKTKIRNKSNVANDMFEAKIIEIQPES